MNAAPPILREVTEASVRAALAEVPDPEIPAVSVLDLGMVEGVSVDGGAIRVELLPTFIGCPALDRIREDVAARLATFGRAVDVQFTNRVPWTTERITPAGRERLRRAGFAPPVVDPADSRCPHCGSADVQLENLFGPTLCRSLAYCRSCRQPFEQFKPV